MDRTKALADLRATIDKAKGVLDGTVAYDSSCGAPLQYARHLIRAAEANMHFCIRVGLLNPVDDQQRLRLLAQQMGEVNERYFNTYPTGEE